MSGVTPALFERYPHLWGRVPWRPLGSYPTPVERMEELSASLGEGVEVWVKRDDVAGELYGGNKVRKLEFVLAEALEAGCERVWTVGGIGSHQVLATALYGRELGLRVGAVVFPQPVTPHVREVLRAMVEADCELFPVGHMLTVPLGVARLVSTRLVSPRLILRESVSGESVSGESLRGDGRRKWAGLGRRGAGYAVPPGSSSPSGALGYVSAALELAEQIRRGECPLPEAVVTAYGSAGTAAGLMVGLRLAGLDVPVYGVRVVIRALGTAGRLAGLCEETAARLKDLGVPVPGDFPVGSMQVVGDQVGVGYGYPTVAGREAISLAARDGLELETTYTGKALAGLVSLVRQRRPGWRRVLFWNTFNSRPLRLSMSEAKVRERLPGALADVLG